MFWGRFQAPNFGGLLDSCSPVQWRNPPRGLPHNHHHHNHYHYNHQLIFRKLSLGSGTPIIAGGLLCRPSFVSADYCGLLCPTSLSPTTFCQRWWSSNDGSGMKSMMMMVSVVFTSAHWSSGFVVATVRGTDQDHVIDHAHQHHQSHDDDDDDDGQYTLMMSR